MRVDTSEIVDAYRADLDRAERTSLSDHDGEWLIVGTMVQHAARLRASDRAEYLATAAATTTEAASDDTLAEAIRQLSNAVDLDGAVARVASLVATDAEDADAFAVATTILDHARTLLRGASVLLQGRLLSHQARILRKIGELDVAQEQSELLVRLGTEHHEDELVIRGLIGQAVLARHRGNYPEVRELFRQVYAIPASTSEIAALHTQAHHGMLVAAAVAGDFDTALRHGALAIKGATSAEFRLELLQNLASVCYDMGEFRGALHCSLRVLCESKVLRVRMAAFGTGALAAARLGDRDTVETLAKAADPHVRGTGIEHAIAELAREFFEAFAWLGETDRANSYRSIAVDRATSGRYFEILHRLDEFQVPAAPGQRTVITLTSAAREVADELNAGNSSELLAAAIAGG